MQTSGLGIGIGLGHPSVGGAVLNALNDRIVFDGDSIVAHGYVFGTGGTSYYVGNGSWGFSTWAMALSEARLYQPVLGNVAVPGETTAGLYARRAATAALLPKVAVALCGTNDITSGVPAATIAANLHAWADAMAGSGARHVVLLTIPPRYSPSALSGPQEAERATTNDLIRALASSRIKVIDLDLIGLSSGDFGDGLHPNTGGAFKIGQAVAALLDAITVADDSIAGWTNTLAPNPTMAGTGGSADGGATGVVADWFGLNAGNAGGATVVGSKGTLADGSPAQVITISGSYSGSGRFINCGTFVASTLSAGDVIEAIAEIEVSGLSAEIVRVGTVASIYDGGFATLLQAEGIYSGDGSGHPTDVARQVIRTPAWPIQAGAPAWQSFGMFISLKDVGGATPVSGVIKVGEVKARKVPLGA